jgi:hypothetical protein
MKPLGKKHTQAALKHLADKGIEMTPDEIAVHHKAAYATIRSELRKRGFKNVPDDDEGLFLLMSAIKNGTYRPK